MQQLESDLQAQRRDNVQLKEQVSCSPSWTFHSLKREEQCPQPLLRFNDRFRLKITLSLHSSSLRFLSSTSSSLHPLPLK